LMRTRLGAFLLIGGLAASALMFPFVNKMPLPIQRCLAFIPGVPVTQSAKVDAMNSTIWRVEMWQVLLGEVPKYLVLGKGYAINAADLYLAGQAERRGLVKGYEVSILAGAYHSGPLSVIIPFGIFGVIGFLWLLGAGLWVLYRNYRYGDPEMRLINTFLFAYFAMRVIVFFFIFGALDSELAKFTAILGLSVAINRGVRKPVQEPVKQVAGLSLQPASP
jgi:O-antigen ligase